MVKCKKKSVCVCVRACVREREWGCVWLCVRVRESEVACEVVCVCVCEREWGCVWLCVCVRVCEREWGCVWGCVCVAGMSSALVFASWITSWRLPVPWVWSGAGSLNGTQWVAINLSLLQTNPSSLSHLLLLLLLLLLHLFLILCALASMLAFRCRARTAFCCSSRPGR